MDPVSNQFANAIYEAIDEADDENYATEPEVVSNMLANININSIHSPSDLYKFNFMIKFCEIKIELELLNKFFEKLSIGQISICQIEKLIDTALEIKNPIILKMVLDKFNMRLIDLHAASLTRIINLAIETGSSDILDLILIAFSRTVQKIDLKYIINLDMLNKILLHIHILKDETYQSIYIFNKLLGLVGNNIIKIINSVFYSDLCKFFISSRIVAIDYIFKNASNDYIAEINYKYNHILKIINNGSYSSLDIHYEFNLQEIVNKIINSRIKNNDLLLLVPDVIYKVIYSFL